MESLESPKNRYDTSTLSGENVRDLSKDHHTGLNTFNGLVRRIVSIRGQLVPIPLGPPRTCAFESRSGCDFENEHEKDILNSRADVY